MIILQLVHDKIAINEEKIRELDLQESVIRSLTISDRVGHQMLMYSTGICSISVDNYEYIVTIDDNYFDKRLSLEFSYNSFEKYHFTIFNKFMCLQSKSFISDNILIESMLDHYFRYAKFIHELENGQVPSSLSCEYNTFESQNFFIPAKESSDHVVKISSL